MTDRHGEHTADLDDEPGFDGCRRWVVTDGVRVRCGHGEAAHDRRLADGTRDACSLCPRCTGYWPDMRPALLVLSVLTAVVAALVLIFSGATP